MSYQIVLSPNDAEKIANVLELHIVSNLVNEAPVNQRERLKLEVQELNRIQQLIDRQLNVSSN